MKNDQGSFLYKIDAIACFFSKLGLYTASFFIVFVTSMIFVNVMLRAFFQYNLPFVEEWASLSLVPMSYLGLGYTLRQDKHISADILIRHVSEKTKYILLLCISIIAFCIVLFFVGKAWDLFSYQLARQVTTNGPMRTPLWIPSSTILIGLTIFLIDTGFWVLHLALRLCKSIALAFEY